ncbi:MAG TPA: glutamine synthetase family protein [Acetobacteraceae bacterium]|nr:glutamine synthetase family protein [Acetobacteraceae bacterium]
MTSDSVQQLVAGCSLGRHNFVAQSGLDSPARQEILASILAKIDAEKLEVVRVGFVDTHGIVRVRPVEARLFAQAARNAVPFTTALLAMDSANNIFQNVFARDGGFGRDTMGGAGDMFAVPDLSTFRVLPWAHKCAWVVSDLYLSSGERCPFDPRLIMQTACELLAQQGLTYVGGVEVECHIVRVTDPRNDLADGTQPPMPPEVEALRHGYQYMSENVLDELEPVITRIRHALIGVGLPLRIVDAEWGPGQIEISLEPMENTTAADAVIILRAAVKQVCRRMGLLASFMTKPGLPNVLSCGWHLHQSLFHTVSGKNAFAEAGALMSTTGMHFVGGLLEHARATIAFSNPTVNGYKRLSDNPLAPSRVVWSFDNKGAMCRLVGGMGDPATHVENRSGEPAANPYLYMGSQIIAGLDGMANEIDPGSPLPDPHAQVQLPLMPRSLDEAVDALSASTMFRNTLGDEFIDHYVAMRRQEIGRFRRHVTDWEHREYFEAF